MQFKGDGIAVDGEPPIMTIEAQCLPGQDPADLASIVIPTQKILQQKPANATFKFDGSDSTYAFSGSGDAWPRIWILKTIIFKNRNGADKIVAFDQIIKDGLKPTVVEF
jgi:hypothetical protein